jgi:hypothetical protein
MRLFGYLILFALIGYGIWPYFTVFRLDEAINQEGTAQLATMVDLPAIRANYKARVAAGVDGIFPSGDPDSVMSWIRQNVDRLGDSALEQAITLPWVRDTCAVRSREPPARVRPICSAGSTSPFSNPTTDSSSASAIWAVRPPMCG